MTYKDEWGSYYRFLERLRQSGITNMFGAAPYLHNQYEDDGMGAGEANKILISWMENYSDLVADGVIVRGD